jgi:hypothetical protein
MAPRALPQERIVPRVECDPLKAKECRAGHKGQMSPNQCGAITLYAYVRYRTHDLNRIWISCVCANAPAKTRPGRNARIFRRVRFNNREKPAAAVVSRSRLPWNPTGRAASALLAWEFSAVAATPSMLRCKWASFGVLALIQLCSRIVGQYFRIRSRASDVP